MKPLLPVNDSLDIYHMNEVCVCMTKALSQVDWPW